MITNAEEGAILASSELLGGIAEQQLRQLAFASDRFAFADGATLVRACDPPDRGFVLLSGEVGVYLDVEGVEVELMSLGKGDLLGAKALVSGEAYRATARAKGKVEVLRIPRDAFLTLLESDKAAMEGVLDYLAKQRASAEKALGLSSE